MASILDVARLAKVSPSTVSLVVNHGHRVSPATRQRVEAVIRRLGYRGRDGSALSKSRQARALRLGFIYTPDALINGADTHYNRQIIQGVEQSLTGSASSVSIMRGFLHVDEDHMLSQRLDAGEFDGMLIAGLQPNDGYIERITAAGLPMVVFNRSTESGLYSVVTVDYVGGGRTAIDHLFELGHRRIGLLLQSTSVRWPPLTIRNGCLDALRRHQIEAVYDGMIPAQGDTQAWKAIARQLLDAGVTAIQTGDVPAVQLLDALADLGVSVPGDLSVMGFDDRGLTSQAGLKPTTIGYDKVRMGRLAGRMIQRLSQSGCTLRWMGMAIQKRLVNGQTTSAPLS
jgi:LacI family transcriptional regulator